MLKTIRMWLPAFKRCNRDFMKIIFKWRLQEDPDHELRIWKSSMLP